MSSVHTTAYQRLVAAAAGLKVPDAVRRVATAPPQDPQPGQIWRAVWEDTIQLLLITAAGDDDTLRAVPASFERYADADTLLLPAQATTLEQALGRVSSRDQSAGSALRAGPVLIDRLA
ncbi:hypothetical protein ACFY8S_36495 [Streptomyces hygroscopicus]|uniref:hypothetical protein n=1 Tax=Streptomyces hygroscopicus TaxID=1912 RepID=UPI00367AB5B9